MIEHLVIYAEIRAIRERTLYLWIVWSPLELPVVKNNIGLDGSVFNAFLFFFWKDILNKKHEECSQI